MANQSSVPTVKAALLTKLQGASGLSTLHTDGAITWGHPGDNLQAEAIWMGDARFQGEETRVGNRSHDERYTIPVIVFVLQQGDDAQAAESRWYALVATVEQALRADATLGGVAGLHWAVVNGKEPHGFVPSGGQGYEGAVLVGCHARI